MERLSVHFFPFTELNLEGMFFDVQSLLCIISKEDQIVSDRIPVSVLGGQPLFPYISLQTASKVEYALATKDSDFEKLKFRGLGV